MNEIRTLLSGLAILMNTLILFAASGIATAACWPLLLIFNGTIKSIAKQKKLGALRAGIVICKFLQIVLGLVGTVTFLAVCAVLYAGGFLINSSVGIIATVSAKIFEFLCLGQADGLGIWYGWLLTLGLPIIVQYFSLFFGGLSYYNKIEYILAANHRKNSLNRDLICARRAAGKFLDVSEQERKVAEQAILKAIDKFDLRVDIMRRSERYKKSAKFLGFWAILPPILYGIWRGLYSLIFFKAKAASCRKGTNIISDIQGEPVFAYDGRVYQGSSGKFIGYCRDSIVYSKNFKAISFIAISPKGQTEVYAFPETSKVDLSEYAV